MKRNILFIAIGLPALLATSAFAGEAEHTALILSKLSKDSSPANVTAVALQQKKLYCEQNAKNQRLHDTEKESYVTSCMNKNEALERSREVASADVNNALRQSPTGAGNI